MTSKSKSSTATTQTQTTRNLNIQDVEGITVADSSGVTITTTDQGALQTAERISLAGLEEAFGFGTDALGLADRSVGRVADIADITSARLLEGSERAGELVRGAFSDAFSLASGVLERGQLQLGNTVTALNTIARQQSTSEAERIQDIATKGLVGAGVLIAGVVLFAIFGRGRA